MAQQNECIQNGTKNSEFETEFKTIEHLKKAEAKKFTFKYVL
jgi:hypothetical protein